VTRHAHGRSLTVAAVAIIAGAVSGCSVSSSNPPPPAPSSEPPAAATLMQPQPDRPGPLVQVDGQVSWRTIHVGCAEMLTAAGQHLRLIGQLATDRERAALGSGPRSEHLRVTGFVPQRDKVGETVCSSGIPFKVERVEPTLPR
jgi:hypothetical protein